MASSGPFLFPVRHLGSGDVTAAVYRYYGRTDATDRITFPANAVGNDTDAFLTSDLLEFLGMPSTL